MAKIVLTLPEGEELFDGKQITFRAPCGNDTPTGLSVNGTDFTFVDASGTNVLACNGKFVSGAMVAVLLDVTGLKAYILNPATPNFVIADTKPTVGAASTLPIGTYIHVKK